MVARDHGADKAEVTRFEQTFNSFGVQTKANKANELSNTYQIQGTPSLAVGGKFVGGWLCFGEYDLVIGARSTGTQATHARRFGNTALNRLAGYLTDRDIPDLTSGFRAARREHLREFLHLLPNGFSTPTTTTLAFIKAGYNVVFEPVEARQRTGQSKIRLARDGTKFLMIILRIVTLFSPLRVFLPFSIASFLVGFGYALWTIWTQSHVTNSSTLLIIFSVIVFLVGLVSEQISALRFEGRQ